MMDFQQFAQSAITGLLTGVFTAGTVWGVLKTELRYLRRDVDEVRRKIFKISATGDLQE